MDAASKELERYRRQLKTYLYFMLAQTNDDHYILSLIKGGKGVKPPASEFNR
jgi:hypothetical protein